MLLYNIRLRVLGFVQKEDVDEPPFAAVDFFSNFENGIILSYQHLYYVSLSFLLAGLATAHSPGVFEKNNHDQL